MQRKTQKMGIAQPIEMKQTTRMYNYCTYPAKHPAQRELASSKCQESAILPAESYQH